MKVLVLGSTGNVGSRIVSALQVHGHTPILYLRSPEKLPNTVLSAIPSENIITGSATDVTKMKQTILDHDCDAVVNAAGLAGILSKTDAFPAIFKAVADAAVQAGKARGRPLRAWFMAGFAALDLPENSTGGVKGKMIMNYLPLFPDHRTNYEYLLSIPASDLNWSTFCASQLKPATASGAAPASTADGLDLARAAQSQSSKVVGSPESPPEWKPTLAWIPLLGAYLNILLNAGGYVTTLEQAAEFMVADLEKGMDSEYSLKRAGIIAK